MSSLLLAEHRGYLADKSRVVAFERALAAVVRPGSTVLDLGSGTGVLGLLACRAGARHVYAVDGSTMVAVARGVVRANGMADRFTFVKAHSLRASLPERVDVVVADQLGPFGLEAGVFEAFADARLRHLAPGGTLLPGRLRLLVAPVELPALWSEVAFWDDRPAGIDLSPLGPLARNSRYFTTASPDDVLSQPGVVADTDPGDAGALPIRGTVRLIVERPGTLHGLAGWFDATLSPGVGVSNSPLAADRLDRSHTFLPAADPVVVAPGHEVTAEIAADPRDEQYRWTITVRDAAGTVIASSSHSTLEGTPLTREDLARTRPDATPRLTPDGEARRTVLSLCDGRRALHEIEGEVLDRHPDLFPDRTRASAFVTRVLRNDAS
ncbi:MAG TPA: 50S ribosomal protein L11 methyltransferase [Acidimicrobiales bacterium]|nr:50S ribosomal protein L11 methyltransferase [Acidimicrobiales bacterium]